MYVYFLNGIEKRQLIDGERITIENKSVKNQEEWEEAIEVEYSVLGINDAAKRYISGIFIDCK